MPSRMLSWFIESVVAMVKSENFSKEWFTEIYADQVKEKNDKLLKEEGRTEGYISGEKDGKLETAKNMIKDKLPIETIVKYTWLSKQEVEELQA